MFIQSFEVGNLKRLREMTSLRLVQLMGDGSPPDSAATPYADMASPAGLKAIAAYANGIGPDKKMVLPRTPDGHLAPATSLVADAHAAGLLVHPWTLRAENYFLPADFKSGADPRAHGDLAAEACAFYKAGVDGIFSDFPGEAAKARAACR